MNDLKISNCTSINCDKYIFIAENEERKISGNTIIYQKDPGEDQQKAIYLGKTIQL
jgi:hypothetical protein